MGTNIASQAIQGTRWQAGSKKYCLVATLDERIALNTARWDRILQALADYCVPDYLLKVIKSYFCGRELQYFTADGKKTHQESAGVPQGSVLGPLLWNAMYDGVFRLALHPGADLVGFADDVAIVLVGKEIRATEQTCSTCMACVQRWLSSAGLQLAAQKTEAVDRWRVQI